MKDKNEKEIKDRQVEEKPKEVTISVEELSKLKAAFDEKEKLQDKYLRLLAEFDNTRKRMERERQDFIKFANEGIISESLNIMDDLERTVELAQSQHQDLASFLKGVEMILAHLYELLKEYGVRPIETKGKIFNPNFHEALMQVENKDLPENTIVEELQKGYMLNDRVIRTAKVKVSKRPV